MSSGRPESHEEEGPFTLLTRHVVVPAAIIAMVSAFLFYLIEVRSLFLEGGHAFKQVGLCFAAATVLIARYGRMSGGAEPLDDVSVSGRATLFGSAELNQEQGCYTGALGVATLLFMIQRSTFVSLLPNLLIVFAVWRFATGVTRALSLEGELQAGPKEKRLYGLERLRLERFQERMREERGPAWGRRLRRRRVGDAHGNPVAAVARLAGLALLVFAVGEPFLLKGPPEVTERALADVIVFLFATALVLAAGSAVGTLRHTLAAGGRVAPAVLPVRIVVAALLAVGVLASTLAIPGIEFKGQGTLRRVPPAGQSGSGDGQTDRRQSDSSRQGSAEGPARPNRPGDAFGEQPLDQPQPTQGAQPSMPRPGLVGRMSGLGKLLRVPFVLGLLLMALLAANRLRPYLPSLQTLLDRLSAWLRRLWPERAPPPPPKIDPFAGLSALATLPPREAVLSAYQRLLAALEGAGHPRPDRSTPYEHLQALPNRLQPVAEPARELTDLYVLAAYGDGEPTEADRERALAALSGMRSLQA